MIVVSLTAKEPTLSTNHTLNLLHSHRVIGRRATPEGTARAKSFFFLGGGWRCGCQSLDLKIIIIKIATSRIFFWGRHFNILSTIWVNGFNEYQDSERIKIKHRSNLCADQRSSLRVGKGGFLSNIWAIKRENLG